MTLDRQNNSATCLREFPLWLLTLAKDSESLLPLLPPSALSSGARCALAGGLSYLFCTVDLIPDGTSDIGFLDEALVLRVAAALAIKEAQPGELGSAGEGVVAKLAADAELIRDFLGADYPRLERYVRGLRDKMIDGCSLDAIVGDRQARADFTAAVHLFTQGYRPAAAPLGGRSLMRLRAFLDAKLPH